MLLFFFTLFVSFSDIFDLSFTDILVLETSNRERYGAGDTETDKSFHYMVEALEDFIMVLKEEAETPQQKQQLMQTLQNSMR